MAAQTVPSRCFLCCPLLAGAASRCWRRRPGPSGDPASQPNRLNRSRTGSPTSSTRRGAADSAMPLLQQTLVGLEPLAAGHPERSQPGRAEPGVRPLSERARSPGRRRSRARMWPRTHRTLLDRIEAHVQRPAPFHDGHLGVREPVRPADRTHAGLSSARHAGLGTAARRVLQQRALQRADDGRPRLHRRRRA